METYTSRSRSNAEPANHLLNRARQLLIEGDPYSALDLLNSIGAGNCVPDALHLSALAWAKACKPEQAIQALQMALEQNPNSRGWWLDLAKLQYAQMFWPQSAESFGRVAALGPLDEKCLRLHASALRFAGEYGHSIETLEEYLSANPSDYECRADVAQLYGMCGFHHEELRHRNRIAQERESSAGSLAALARAEMQAGQTKRALATACQSLEMAPDAQLGSECLVMRLHDDEQTAASIRKAHQRWARQYIKQKPRGPARKNSPDPDRPLRIGYVCGEGQGAPSYYFLLPLLLQRHRQRFHVTWYHTNADQGERTRTYAEHADRWRDVSAMDDDAVAELARTDEIDVLVDVSGHYEGRRLGIFSADAAPIQTSFPNYPSTTGVAEIQYIVTDNYVCPPGDEGQYTEQPVRAESGYLAYSMPAAPPLTASPFAHKGAVTFGVFQRPAKMNKAFWDAAAHILNQCANSTILIHYASRELDESNSLAQQALRHELENRGVSGSRVEFAGRRNAFEHLSIVSRTDIALDTFPYNGQTTTCECLLMGIPVISLAGRYHVARVGLSLLERVGCGELVSKTWQEYTDFAVRLAGDRLRLTSYRRELRRQLEASSLVNGIAVQGIEAAYLTMWKQWCQQ